MPYCENCGRKLNDGEICSCTAPAQQQTPPPQQYGQQPWGYPQNGQPYPNQPYPYPYPQIKPVAYDGTPLPPPPQPSRKWLLAIIIPLGVLFITMAVIIFGVLVPSFSRYKVKAKHSSMNSAARGINSAAVSTLNELRLDEEWVMGDYIISSDSSKNVYVGFDEEKFYKKEKFHFAELDKYDYFIVVEDGKPVYAAASEGWNDKKACIGTYPTKYVVSSKKYENVKYSVSDTGDVIKDNETLKDVYDAAYKEFDEKLIPKHDHEER